MQPRASRAIVLFVAALLSACVAPPAEEPTDASNPIRGEAPPWADRLRHAPPPVQDGATTVSLLEEFVANNPDRVTFTPGDPAAADWLVERARKLLPSDWEVRLLEFPLAQDKTGTNIFRQARAVEAVRWGTTTPELSILWGGHYDSVAQAPTAAYDNGSGTTVSLAVAEMMGRVPTNKTLRMLIFNGEEGAGHGSGGYTTHMWPANETVQLFIGFDMVGIGYPAPFCQCTFSSLRGWDDLYVLMEDVLFDFLKLPRGDRAVQLHPNNPRGSDEGLITSVTGVPNLRWAGMELAADYPAYHMPDDTPETIYSTAGSRELYEKGIEVVLESVYYTILALDEVERPTG